MSKINYYHVSAPDEPNIAVLCLVQKEFEMSDEEALHLKTLLHNALVDHFQMPIEVSSIEKSNYPNLLATCTADIEEECIENEIELNSVELYGIALHTSQIPR